MKTLLKYTILFFIFISSIIITTQIAIDDIKDDNYQKEAKTLQKQLKTLIDQKQSSTKIIGVSLSQNESIKDAIISNKPDLINLKEISKNYRMYTNFKNVWLQIVTKDGISFSRSWVKKRGDSLLNIRMDIPIMLNNPEIKSHISTGKFDLTFKAMVPIYKDGKFIGIFEVITHFNSISKILAKNDIESVFVVDKLYKKQLTKAFTKIFIDDYYVANFDAPKNLQGFLSKDNTLEKLIDKNTNFYIDEKNDRFITIYHLHDIKGKEMAYLFMFKKLSSIKHENTNPFRIAQFSLIMFGLFIFILISLYSRVKKNEKNLINQKIKTQKIFDAGPAITILTDGVQLRNANKEFFNFFDKYSSIEEFKKEHDCICDFFEYVDDENYIYDREVDGKIWMNYLVENNLKSYKVKMSKNNKEHHFVVIANISNTIEEDRYNLIVVSFVDITEEVRLQNDLRQKDKILLQQSKMVSMGEMIGNIAHQWRQPLSVISTVATGLKLNIQFKKFNEKDAIEKLDILNRNTQYLSKTIDDFRNFFNKKNEKNSFDLNKLIKENINLIDVNLKNNDIELLFDGGDKTVTIESYENIFIQALLNIINNAKDAFLNKEIENKIIKIETSLTDDKIVVSIKDNAGGIDESIINRVFEPYFTTKHKSQGTGIGLYMTEQIVTKQLNGKIDAKNSIFIYDTKSYKGAEFIITLPVN